MAPPNPTTPRLVVIQDADLEYDPADYEKLVSPILRGRADVVSGTRGFAGHSAYSYWFVIGNQLVTTATNILFNCYIQDMETGFKVMRTSLMRRLGLRGNRFDVEPEITGRILRLGYRIYEVPIDYSARTREQGKKLTWLDGVKALSCCWRSGWQRHADSSGEPDPYHRERLHWMPRSRATARSSRTRGSRRNSVPNLRNEQRVLGLLDLVRARRGRRSLAVPARRRVQSP